MKARSRPWRTFPATTAVAVATMLWVADAAKAVDPSDPNGARPTAPAENAAPVSGAEAAPRPAEADAPPGSDPATAQLPPITVEGDRSAPPPVEGAPLSTQTLRPGAASSARGADAGAILQDVPGAAVMRNGPQSGIVQLRGLGGDRVKVSVDGATITPACPNHMDPPLHYASPSGVDSLTVIAGSTPVSLGGDSIGGSVLLQSPALPFATGDTVLSYGDTGALYRGSNQGWGAHGGAGVATDDLSLAYHGAREEGDDLRFPGGRVRASGYDTQQHTVRSALRTHDGRAVWGVETGFLRTRDSGTPALPMDMIEDDGTRLAFDGDLAIGAGSLRGLVYYNAIDHRMDNYSLRPVAPGVMKMFSDAVSDDTGAELGATFPRDRHTLRAGTGFHLARSDVYQQNAVTGMQQDTFRDAWRARIGTYVEWQADWSSRWTTLAGARNDTVVSDAGDIERFNPMGPAAADAAAFNARGHGVTDANFDVTAALRLNTGSYGSWEFAFARKNRSPSLLERYLWTPLAASAGLADGRTYLGNLDLDPEVSHQLSLSGRWSGRRWQATATPFYNFVSDYIQGVPVPYGPASVLQFQNLDRADLYGVDVSGSFDLPWEFTLRGWMSYVRGRDREHDDNLYRIAPLRGLFALDHHPGAWRNAIEVAWSAQQHDTSAYNDEPSTSGWAVLNLRAGYTIRERLKIALSLENVFDDRYSDHLGGINRVVESDVAVGQRLPGAGRFVFLSIDYEL